MFNRPHHQRIASLLASLNADFLAHSGCYFGGGTALVLSLNEYRESVDVDFLCSSLDGYRALRNTISSASLGDILALPVELVRDVRHDQLRLAGACRRRRGASAAVVHHGRDACEQARVRDWPDSEAARGQALAEASPAA